MTSCGWRIGLVVVAAIGVSACGAKSNGGASGGSKGDAPAAVTLNAADVALARRATLRSGVPVNGTLEPKVRITVGAPLAEQLVEVYVNEGDRVRQGQPLARFKDEVLKAAADYAAAEVTTQRMNVQVAVAESARAVALFAEGAIAQRDRDNALVALEAARSRLSLAVSQEANAQDRLRSTVLTAPAAGVISKRYVQAGDRVDNGKAVFELVDTRVLQLTASVPTEWLPELRVGRPVSLTLAQLAGTTVSGRISRINPTADPATRQIQIYVDVPNPGEALVGGLFASGLVVTRQAVGAVAVPAVAVRHGARGVGAGGGGAASGAPYLMLVSRGRITARPVALGVSDDAQGLVEATSGVAPGDTVIVGPIEGLAEGTPVAIAGASAPSGNGR